MCGLGFIVIIHEDGFFPYMETKMKMCNCDTNCMVHKSRSVILTIYLASQYNDIRTELILNIIILKTL